MVGMLFQDLTVLCTRAILRGCDVLAVEIDDVLHIESHGMIRALPDVLIFRLICAVCLWSVTRLGPLDHLQDVSRIGGVERASGKDSRVLLAIAYGDSALQALSNNVSTCVACEATNPSCA